MTTHDSTLRGPDVEHSIGTNGRVAVRVASWDVELVAVDSDVVRVRAADGGDLPRDIEIQREADGITIRQPSLLGGLNLVIGRSGDARIAVEVPATARTNVVTASGDVHARGLRSDGQFRTASGDVTIVDASGTLLAESVSGDVAIDVTDTADLTVKTVSGDVAVKGGTLDRVAVTTTSGDVLLGSELGAGPHSIATLSGDAIIRAGDGVTVTARTVAGDLSSSLPHRSEGGPGRRSIIVGNGVTGLQFRSVSGDLRVVGSGEKLDLIEIPMPPGPPNPPAPPRAPASPGRADAGTGDEAAEPAPAVETERDTESARLTILRALERGEIDISEATARLAGLDGTDR
jgi:hypothetical protein